MRSALASPSLTVAGLSRATGYLVALAAPFCVNLFVLPAVDHEFGASYARQLLFAIALAPIAAVVATAGVPTPLTRDIVSGALSSAQVRDLRRRLMRAGVALGLAVAILGSVGLPLALRATLVCLFAQTGSLLGQAIWRSTDRSGMFGLSAVLAYLLVPVVVAICEAEPVASGLAFPAIFASATSPWLLMTVGGAASEAPRVDYRALCREGLPTVAGAVAQNCLAQTFRLFVVWSAPASSVSELNLFASLVQSPSSLLSATTQVVLPSIYRRSTKERAAFTLRFSRWACVVAIALLPVLLVLACQVRVQSPMPPWCLGLALFSSIFSLIASAVLIYHCVAVRRTMLLAVVTPAAALLALVMLLVASAADSFELAALLQVVPWAVAALAYRRLLGGEATRAVSRLCWVAPIVALTVFGIGSV